MDAAKSIRIRSRGSSRKGVYERLLEEREKATKLIECQSLKSTNIQSQQEKKSMKIPLIVSVASKSPTNKQSKPIREQAESAVLYKASSKKSLKLKEKCSFENNTQLEVGETKRNVMEFVAHKQLGYNNVPDLTALESITAVNNDKPTSAHSTPNLSFNPAEITARSTLLQRNTKTQMFALPTMLINEYAPKSDWNEQQQAQNRTAKESMSFGSKVHDTRSSRLSRVSQKSKDSNDHSHPKRVSQLTVDEILATSFASKVRKIRQSLVNISPSNCFYDGHPKNPHQANSFDSSTEYRYLKNAHQAGGALQDETFTPGELFANQLGNDKIEWAKENFLSNDFQRKLADEAVLLAASNAYNPTANWSSMTSTGKEEFSAGEFFQVKSAELSVMVKGKSPNKDRTPFALISDDSVISTSMGSAKKAEQTSDEFIQTTAIDNRTYIEPASVVNQSEGKANNDESKDSGNGTEKINQLNLSGIKNVGTSTEYRNIVDFVKHFETQRILKNEENIKALNKNLFSNAGLLTSAVSLLNKESEMYGMSCMGHACSSLSRFETEAVNDEVICSADRNSPRKLNLLNQRLRNGKIDNNNDDVNHIPISYTQSAASDVAPTNQVVLTKTKQGATIALCAKRFSSTRLKTAENQYSPCAELSSTSLNSFYFSASNKMLTCNHKGFRKQNTFEQTPCSSPLSCLSSVMNSPHEGISNTSENCINFKHNGQCSTHCDNVKYAEKRFIDSTALVNNSNFVDPFSRTYSHNSCTPYKSESTHFDGTFLPIKVTPSELSWGSIPLHKSSQRSLQIRNTTNKWLAVRIQISGPGFHLANPETTLLKLSAQECCTNVINFCATMTGPAVGALSFQSTSMLNNSPKCNITANNELIISLYAFGGHASISIQNILVGPLNMPFLPLGDVFELFQPLKGKFQIHNKGPLLGFALFEIETACGLQVPGLCSAFKMEPQCTLVAPNSFVAIRVVFTPSRNDIKKIRRDIKDVLTLAKMRIVFGDEGMRQRLRQVRHYMPTHLRENIFTKSLEKLWQFFPGESTMTGLDAYKDESSIADDISTYLKEKEIAITLNNNVQDEFGAEFSTIFNDDE